MYIIIAGCRKVGANLARILSQENHDVVVIDSDDNNLKTLGSGFNGLSILGMPIDEDILRSAGIERADALAAVTNDDNMNVMVSRIAKEIFKVPKVITRVYDPERETVFNRMGLRTICPTTLAVDKIRDLLVSLDRYETANFVGTNVFFKNIKPSRSHVDKKVSDIRDQYIFGLIKDGAFLLASPDTVIHADDTVVVAELGE